jgi:hypothetical protein
VMDRERKWKRRNTSGGRYQRKLEYARRTRKTAARRFQDDGEHHGQPGGTAGSGGGEVSCGRRLFAVF